MTNSCSRSESKNIRLLKCILNAIATGNQTLLDIYGETVDINDNTDDVESLLATINTTIITQTDIIEASLSNIELLIEAQTIAITDELVNIQGDLGDILLQLQAIQVDIQTGNSTLIDILTQLGDIETLLDTINTSINDMNTNLGTKLDTIDVSINAVTTAVQDLQTAVVAELVDVRDKLQTIIDKPDVEEIPICIIGTPNTEGSLAKDFDKDGNETVGNRKFYQNGAIIPEPTSWQEGSCASILLEDLITEVQAGNVTLIEIRDNTANIITELQNIDANTDNIEPLLGDIITSVTDLVPYIDDIEPTLTDIYDEIVEENSQNGWGQAEVSNGGSQTFTAGTVGSVTAIPSTGTLDVTTPEGTFTYPTGAVFTFTAKKYNGNDITLTGSNPSKVNVIYTY